MQEQTITALCAALTAQQLPFAQGEPLTAAAGHFIHVYVDRESRRPAVLPALLRAVLEPLTVA